MGMCVNVAIASCGIAADRVASKAMGDAAAVYTVEALVTSLLLLTCVCGAGWWYRAHYKVRSRRVARSALSWRSRKGPQTLPWPEMMSGNKWVFAGFGALDAAYVSASPPPAMRRKADALDGVARAASSPRRAPLGARL